MERQMGQADGVTVLADGAGEQIDVLGEILTVKVASAATGGALTIVEIRSEPGGGPPAMHTHPPAEVFYVLDGEFEITTQGQGGPVAHRAARGSVVHIRPNVPHNYRNAGSASGRMLAIFTDPAMEAFHRSLSAAAAGGPPDPARLMPVLEQYGVAFLAPPTLSSPAANNAG